MISRICIGIIFFALVGFAFAQQDPLLTQYMFNPYVYNPAYAGSQEAPVFITQARTQLLGPQNNYSRTVLLNGHTLLNDAKSGVGGGLSMDANSYFSKLGVNGTYSYHLIFEKTTLAMGLSAGAINYRTTFSSLTLENPDDIAFNNGQSYSKILPNFGTGLFYYHTRYYLGISVPRILKNKLNDAEATLNQHVYFTGGLVFPATKAIKMKPNVLLRYTSNASLQYDLNLNILLQEIIWFGCSYRSQESLDLLLELHFSKQMRFGYSYDISLTEVGKYSANFHEFMIGYKFIKSVKEEEKVYSPRYF